MRDQRQVVTDDPLLRQKGKPTPGEMSGWEQETFLIWYALQNVRNLTHSLLRVK